MPDSAPRAAIVDDEPLWLDLLRVALEHEGIEVIAAFSDPQTAIEQWPSDIDIAILDVDLNGKVSGFALARALRSEHPGIPVIFLTSVADPWIVDEAAASVIGGTSYLLKRSVADVSDLRACIEATIRGEVVAAPEVLSALHGEGPMAGLTPTQGRILRLMALGRTNQQIATELGIAVKTVEGNITKIARVLGVTSDENLRVGCVTRYLAATQGPRRLIRP